MYTLVHVPWEHNYIYEKLYVDIVDIVRELYHCKADVIIPISCPSLVKG